eukprot:2472798-Amphidinium_carterae.1
MHQRHGKCWVPSRRFVIQQGLQGWIETEVNGASKKVPKLRCIDDFTESGIKTQKELMALLDL